jgi:Flp pilus assembly protein TadD
VAAVVCLNCGAKTKEGRLRCPRCGEILETAPAPAPAPATVSVPAAESAQAADGATTGAGLPAVYLRYRGPLVLAGTLLSVILLLVVIARQREPVPQASPVRAPARPAAAPVQTAAPGRPDPGFLDPKTGGAAAYASGDYTSALEHYKKAVSLNPNDGDALNNLGQLFARNGDAAVAIPYFQKAVRLYPSVWSYRFNLAHAHGRLGDWSQAVDDYQKARDLFPEDYVTHFNLGMALHKMGDEEAAVSVFRKGAELAPSEASFHLSLGISLEHLNRPGDAVKSYEQYLVMSPSAPDADKVKARIEHLRKPV